MDNSKTSFIVITGIIILLVLGAVIGYNLITNYESNSYYVKVEDEMSAKIEALNIDNNRLIITTSGDAEQYCVKSTRSTPDANNICWKKINNNQASISIYKYKKYYIWIKDSNGYISIPMSINTNSK